MTKIKKNRTKSAICVKSLYTRNLLNAISMKLNATSISICSALCPRENTISIGFPFASAQY